MDIEENPFELKELIDSVLDLLGPKATDDGLAVAVTIPGDILTSWIGDANRLRQVLYNLVGNGIKFTKTAMRIMKKFTRNVRKKIL